MIRWLAIAAFACKHPAPAQPDPDGLVRELERVREQRADVAAMMLGRDAWARVIVPPFSRLYDDYQRTFSASLLAQQLAQPGQITARRHFAGDPRLTPSQGRLRWALPVEFPSMVAEIAGHPVDTVFVFDGTGWRALEGLDDTVLAAVHRLDPACGARLALAGPTGHCSEVGWAIADAALRDDRPAFVHACQLATTLCGTRSP